jgi:ABC-type microcin C transport system permease subunit YejB
MPPGLTIFVGFDFPAFFYCILLSAVYAHTSYYKKMPLGLFSPDPVESALACINP